MENQTILFSQKEIEVMKSCIYMALVEGLYHIKKLNIDAGEKDVKGILAKFGMSEPEIEAFMNAAF